jgi:hypothetical protein
MLFVVLIYFHNYTTFMLWHAAKKARSEENTGSTKSQENGADAKQGINKDEQTGKSKNKKGGDKVKNTQSHIEVPKGKLHSDVLVLLRFLFLACPSQNSIFEISSSYSFILHAHSMLTE